MVEVNYLAVLVAGVANMALGALWYSPVLFGKPWMAMMGITPESMKNAKKGMGARYALAFLGGLIMAYVLAHFVFYAGATTWTGGLQAGFWSWLGFIAPVMLGTVLWENRPVKLYALNVGYYLVSLLIMGAILAMWR